MHYSAYIRSGFCDWIDAGQPDTTVVRTDREPTECSARELLVEMCGCSGSLPAYYCSQLNMPEGTTYSEAAEVLLRKRGEDGGSLSAA